MRLAKLLLMTVLVVFLTSLSANLAAAELETSAEAVILTIDHADFDQENEKLISESTTFTVKNKGTENVTVEVSITGLPTDYSVESIADQQINAGAEATFTLSLRVPHRQDSGKTEIGTITIKNKASSETKTRKLVQNTLPMIIIKEIKIEYNDEDGKGKDENFNSEDNNEKNLENNVMVGSFIKLDLEIENRFPRDDYDDSDMENIELQIDADNNDIFPDDFDNKHDLEDMKADATKDLSVEWEIPADADVGDYTIEITLEGEDRYSKYSITKKINMELERKRDDVRISKVVFTPSEVTTCSAGFTIDAELTNYGTRDQSRAGLSIYNAELGINENVHNLNLESFDDKNDRTWKETFDFKFDKKPTAKSYRMDINAYINFDKNADYEAVNLVVKECPTTSTTTGATTTTTSSGSSQNDNNNNTNSNDSTSSQTTGSQAEETKGSSGSADKTSGEAKVTSGEIIKTVENPFTIEDLLLGLVMAGFVFIAAMIVVFAVMLLRRR